MPELPNLLRQRLAETQNGISVHPDADTITAYVEQSLPTTDRQTVVAHLAVCEPCREVVALSQPQLPELALQPVIEPAPVRSWRRLFAPSFGLAAAVAAMAIIAVLVLQLPHTGEQQSAQKQSAHEQQAQATAPADQMALAEDKSTVPTPPTATQTPTSQPVQARAAGTKPESAALLDRAQLAQIRETQSRQRRDESTLKVAAGFTALPAPQPVLSAGLLKKDYVNTNFFADSGDNVVLGKQSNQVQGNDTAAAPQLQAANHAFTSFSDIPANTTSKSNVRLLSPNPAPERFGCPLCSKVVQATAHTLHTITPAIHASSLGTSAMGEPGMFSNTLAKSQSTEISAAPGKDEGGGLANSAALSRSALGTSSFISSPDSAPIQWKVAGGKLIKSAGQSQWEDAYPAAGIEFSSVNVRGKDVWAGGSLAFLIHSHDAGLTWEVVKLGNDATGTIVSIIAGTFNVQIKTSEHQLWSSADGGKTWTLNAE